MHSATAAATKEKNNYKNIYQHFHRHRMQNTFPAEKWDEEET